MRDPIEDMMTDTAMLVEAAEAAGRIAMKYWKTDVTKYEKDDGAGPVTVADLEINEMLADRFVAARPDYGWLSEESDDDSARLDAERVFIIDPIDGTRAFIAGEKGFSVAIAIAQRGVVTSAAIHLPARDETFAATLGKGATKNGMPTTVTGADDLANSTILAAKVQMQPERWPGGVPPLDRHFRSSLAWRLSLVAEGRFDCMATFRRSWEWDIAAGALIAAESGAMVTDGTGATLRFNNPEPKTEGIIAAPRGLHPKIMAHRQPQ